MIDISAQQLKEVKTIFLWAYYVKAYYYYLLTHFKILNTYKNCDKLYI